MTAEREAMTLEQMKNYILHRCEMLDGTDEVIFDRSELLIFVDAIETHLSRAAEPVGEVVGVAGSVGEMRVVRWRDRYSPSVGTKLFTHPPEPARDAKDGVLRFAGKVLSASRDNMADVDGGSIQDWAYECGLLESHQLSEDAPDEDRCDWCDGGECECFRYTALGKQCAAMAQESPDAK